MDRLDAATHEALGLFLDRVRAGFDVAEAILFGSRARGDHRTDSDVDVLVVLNGDDLGDVTRVGFAMADIASDVLVETGVNISPLPVWRSAWTQRSGFPNPTLFRNIDREGIRL
ncbi:DNA polymerase III subunit beta [Bosea caraganae]|uniref:DNA polymerase III subunit beta n=1 Tax=Bosea caraganae TaxID=2763117 RepID=A0A370LD78_9HYPH|nr:nucleotidyltransferase domain-containing protein [Bosea caraganae]RDJ27470.1 DNA polymerase III subunit beta [Bosea caraganae]RDJ29485.1 DNA polymerase III subunit beta [Bosea caraganae]